MQRTKTKSESIHGPETDKGMIFKNVTDFTLLHTLLTVINDINIYFKTPGDEFYVPGSGTNIPQNDGLNVFL